MKLKLELCAGVDWRDVRVTSDPSLLIYCNHLWFDTTGFIHLCSDYKEHPREHICQCCEQS